MPSRDGLDVSTKQRRNLTRHSTFLFEGVTTMLGSPIPIQLMTVGIVTIAVVVATALLLARFAD
jgi:hypothetical protein